MSAESLRTARVLFALLTLAGLGPVVPAAESAPPTLLFVGDILLAGKVQGIIHRGGAGAPFAGVSGVFRKADLVVGNLECPLSTRGEALDKTYTFRGRPDAAEALRTGGVGVVTLANNHTGDFGKPALLDTVSACREEGVVAIGAGRNLAEARRPASFTLGEARQTVAVLAYSNMEPKGFYAGRATPGTNPAYFSSLKSDIAAARKRADVVAVLFHFGDELSPTPSRKQRLLAHAAADAGADLVVGHHPHVLQGFEHYGHALIAYSLGNFVFPSHRAETRETAILSFSREADGRIQARVIPCLITGAKPVVAKGKARDRVLAHLRASCQPFGVTVSANGDLAWVE